MTTTHIVILIAFVCLGSAGLAAMQEGFSQMWQQFRSLHRHQKVQKETVPSTLKISFR